MCGNAYEEQDKLLRRIMRENSGTEYGQKYGFSSVSDIGSYRGKVPLTTFSDYDTYIGKITEGQRNILTAAPPVFYNISSGSTGEPKYIPICKEDIDLQKLYFEDAIAGMISEAIPHNSENELFGHIFSLGDVFMTEMPDGTPNGIRSGIYYQTAFKDGRLDCSVFSAPEEAMFPDDLDNMLYVKVRFALADPDITAIHGIFAHRASPIFRFILNNWDSLLRDTENGTVSDCFNVSELWKDYLKKNLPPAPERAEYLRSLPVGDLENNMLRKIWPKLKYIKLITGDLFGTHGDNIGNMIGDIPIHNFAYAASESIIGIAPEMSLKNRYVLLPDACYFEFRHINKLGEPKELVTMRELEKGERYDLIITTVSGLYRYDLADIVEVTGKYGEAPIIRICYRKDVVLNVSDEKLNTLQFENAMQLFMKKTGITANGYFISGNYDIFPPGYELFLETPDETDESFPSIFDSCLRESSINYSFAREVFKISEPSITKLHMGTIAKYDEKCRSEGMRTDQSKPLRIVNDKERIIWFEQFKEKKINGTQKA